MAFTKNLNKITFLYIFIFPLITLMTIYFYIEFDSKIDELSSNMQKIEIAKVNEFSVNIANSILEKTGDDIYGTLEKNRAIRKILEEKIETFISKQYAYIYLIYKGNDGKLRYLLDGSKQKDEKGEFNQKYDPFNDIWEQVFLKKEIQVSTQENIKELWITYLYPIKKDERVLAVLAFDFSIEEYYTNINNIKPLKQFFFYLSMFMMCMLLIGFVQVYAYYRSRKKSIIDPLTNIYNRVYMNEIISSIDLEDYQICMMDIDYFKRVNDTYGHKLGDKVLVNIAKIVKDNIRHEDIFIRYGGEEFLLFVFKKFSSTQIDVPNRIRKAIKNKIMSIGEHEISITVSFGVNTDPSYSRDIDEAIKIADEQLYKAKKGGRNLVVKTLNKQEESESSKKILEVKEALNDKRIICFYQPIFNITNDTIAKYEALVRMIDKDGVIITPANFLPSIYNTATYVELTKCIFELAIEAIRKHDVAVSINFLVEDFFNEDIIFIIKDLLQNDKNIAEKITLEILEQSEITDIVTMGKTISELKKLGLKIALDDFGSGYANFSYFLDLKIDIVKIDGVLIKTIDKNQNAFYITKAIVAFCEMMNLEIIAEAVETKAVLDIVKSLGIENIQGYYLAKPSCVLPVKS